jgi:hypothetical protein
MAKVKSGNGNQKVTFSDQAKGKTTIGLNSSSIKFSTMNKHKRRNYKPYRGQGR